VLLLAGWSVLVSCPGRLLPLTVTFLLAGGPEEDVFAGRAAELARLADVVAGMRRGRLKRNTPEPADTCATDRICTPESISAYSAG